MDSSHGLCHRYAGCCGGIHDGDADLDPCDLSVEVTRHKALSQELNIVHPGLGSAPAAVPAVVATRFNPDVEVKHEQLVSTGKCKKLAITAVMRKRIAIANALFHDD